MTHTHPLHMRCVSEKVKWLILSIFFLLSPTERWVTIRVKSGWIIKYPAPKKQTRSAQHFSLVMKPHNHFVQRQQQKKCFSFNLCMGSVWCFILALSMVTLCWEKGSSVQLLVTLLKQRNHAQHTFKHTDTLMAHKRTTFPSCRRDPSRFTHLLLMFPNTWCHDNLLASS